MHATVVFHVLECGGTVFCRAASTVTSPRDPSSSSSSLSVSHSASSSSCCIGSPSSACCFSLSLSSPFLPSFFVVAPLSLMNLLSALCTEYHPANLEVTFPYPVAQPKHVIFLGIARQLRWLETRWKRSHKHKSILSQYSLSFNLLNSPPAYVYGLLSRHQVPLLHTGRGPIKDRQSWRTLFV